MSRRLVPYVFVVLGWFVLHACLAVYEPSPVLHGRLVDSDSYMRLVRVSALMDGGGWYDGTIMRSNAPYGDTLHWTRPFDVLLVGGALILEPFLGLAAGLFWAGALVSPVLQLATAFAFMWAVGPLVRPSRWLLPPMALVAVFLQPAALASFALGHADHHSLLLLVFVLVFGCTIRSLLRPTDVLTALGGGALAGFGVWLAPEFLVTTAVCLTALASVWILERGRRTSQNLMFAFGFALFVTLGLLTERPVDGLDVLVHDRISILHAALAGIVLIFWLAVYLVAKRSVRPGSPLGRAAMLVIYGLAAGVALIVVDPLIVSGPLAEVDPRLTGLWLDHVVEMAPVLPNSLRNAGRFIFYFGLGFFAVGFAVWAVLSGRRTPAWLGWCFLFIAIAVFWPLAVVHVWFAPYAELVFVMVSAGLVDRLLTMTATIPSEVRRGLVRALCLYALLLGPLALGRGLMDWRSGPNGTTEGQTAQAVCDLPAMATYLETSEDSPQTILAFLDLGPELLYRTRHSVIATPYHRNADGIYDSHLMLAEADDDRTRALMTERGVDWILLCPASPERAFFTPVNQENALYDRLIAGEAPDWLTEELLPQDLTNGFRLFRVRSAESN